MRGRCAASLVLVFATLLVSGCAILEELQQIEPPTTIRVLAYNIHHGEGTDGQLDLDRIAAVITETRPDLVAIQEVDVGVRRTRRVDQAQLLSDLIDLEGVFGDFMEYDGGLYGMALFSRYPILETWNHALPRGPEPRTALVARVELPNGADLMFAGVHLYRTEAERFGQARRLIRTLASEPAPVILAGDFNSVRGDRVMELVEEDFVVPAKRGNPNTFPSEAPDREIDFITYRPASDFLVLESRVLPETLASDHRPIVLELQVR